jgi:DNA adenine methylase
MTTTLTPPLKWHGGKRYVAPYLLKMMPPHTTYCEPFAGGLRVLLAKDPEGVSEVANDIDGQLMNFWSVLREPDLFPRFERRCQATPFSDTLWVEAGKLTGDPDPVIRA